MSNTPHFGDMNLNSGQQNVTSCLLCLINHNNRERILIKKKEKLKCLNKKKRDA